MVVCPDGQFGRKRQNSRDHDSISAADTITPTPPVSGTEVVGPDRVPGEAAAMLIVPPGSEAAWLKGPEPGDGRDIVGPVADRDRREGKRATMATRGFTGRPRQPETAGRIPPGQHLVEDFPVLS